MTQGQMIKYQVQPQSVQLGGMPILRLLPFAGQTTIGPWIFFDHFGPKQFSMHQGVDVPPHPHVNLATVTYLFEGEILHRDSLGSKETITAGAINLMVAGRGIAHSERTPAKLRQQTHSVHGIQLWQALPDHIEECDPAFYHYPAQDLPQFHEGQVEVELLMGQAYGHTSPVITFCDTLYMKLKLPAQADISLPQQEELALYVLEGEVCVDGQKVQPKQLIILQEQAKVKVQANTFAKLLVLGGAKMPPRFMAWNFVASQKARLDQALDDWQQGKFAPVIDDPDTLV